MLFRDAFVCRFLGRKFCRKVKSALDGLCFDDISL